MAKKDRKRQNTEYVQKSEDEQIDVAVSIKDDFVENNVVEPVFVETPQNDSFDGSSNDSPNKPSRRPFAFPGFGLKSAIAVTVLLLCGAGYFGVKKTFLATETASAQNVSQEVQDIVQNAVQNDEQSRNNADDTESTTIPVTSETGSTTDTLKSNSERKEELSLENIRKNSKTGIYGVHKLDADNASTATVNDPFAAASSASNSTDTDNVTRNSRGNATPSTPVGDPWAPSSSQPAASNGVGFGTPPSRTDSETSAAPPRPPKSKENPSTRNGETASGMSPMSGRVENRSGENTMIGPPNNSPNNSVQQQPRQPSQPQQAMNSAQSGSDKSRRLERQPNGPAPNLNELEPLQPLKMAADSPSNKAPGLPALPGLSGSSTGTQNAQREQQPGIPNSGHARQLSSQNNMPNKPRHNEPGVSIPNTPPNVTAGTLQNGFAPSPVPPPMDAPAHETGFNRMSPLTKTAHQPETIPMIPNTGNARHLPDAPLDPRNRRSQETSIAIPGDAPPNRSTAFAEPNRGPHHNVQNQAVSDSQLSPLSYSPPGVAAAPASGIAANPLPPMSNAPYRNTASTPLNGMAGAPLNAPLGSQMQNRMRDENAPREPGRLRFDKENHPNQEAAMKFQGREGRMPRNAAGPVVQPLTMPADPNDPQSNPLYGLQPRGAADAEVAPMAPDQLRVADAPPAMIAPIGPSYRVSLHDRKPAQLAFSNATPPQKIASNQNASSFRQRLDSEIIRSPSQTEMYTIQHGDTYESVCEQAFGTRRLFRALALHNRKRGIDWAPSEGTVIEIPTAEFLKTNYSENLQRGFRKSGTQRSQGFNGNRSDGVPYTVREGDTAFRIATNVLRDTSRWQEIVTLNSDRIEDPMNLQPGMEILLPGRLAARQQTVR